MDPPDTSHGFNKDSPANVYLIVNRELNAYKIGVTNTETERVTQRTREGWELLKVWPVESGRVAKSIEFVVLDLLRTFGYDAIVDKSDMPQKGHTETFSGELDPGLVIDIVDMANCR